MITLKFSEFARGDYDNHGEAHDLYVSKAESCVLYVGISSVDIWARWFSSPNSHIYRHSDQHWDYRSEIGKAVVRCLPESLNWTIELWTVRDCIDFLSKEQGLDLIDPSDIRELEWFTIRKLKPAFNVMGRNYQTNEEDLPEIIRKYKRADEDKALALYQSIFSGE